MHKIGRQERGILREFGERAPRPANAPFGALMYFIELAAKLNLKIAWWRSAALPFRRI
jgi:hypothetical protein